MNGAKLSWMFLCVTLLILLATGVACRPVGQEPSEPPADQPATIPGQPVVPPDQEVSPELPTLPTLPESGMTEEERGVELSPPVAETPAEKEPAETKPTEGRAAEEKPAEMPAEKEPAKEEPAKEEAVKEEPADAKTAETPAEGKPVEEKPAAEAETKSSALPQVPLGLPPLPVPDNNPMTAEKVELGRMLYFDTRVSRDGTISCATCHDPTMAWAEHDSTSDGIDNQKGDRNSPTVINAAYATSQFWDGRAASLEEQALGPVENPVEMGHSMDAVVEGFKKVPEYRDRFQKVFGEEISKENFGKAIAAFERTVLSGNSPYDRLVAGDEKALSEAQKRGMKKFEDACAGCHTPPLFSSFRFFNAGVGMDKAEPDPGRKKVTGEDNDLGKFRVPALREVANTAPYFHDGSEATLEGAVALMAAGGKDNPNLSAMLKVVREEELTADDQKDIVEFLQGLSGEYPIVEAPPLPVGEK